MSLKLYLLRHGETTHSQSGGFCGSLDPGLTESGHQMATAFAEAYADIPWDAIYVSPMTRTRQTAAPICDRVGMEPIIREGLKEMHFGDWEDKTKEEVYHQYTADYVRWLTEPAWNPPTGGGETGVQVASRAMLVISEIEEAHPEGHILVVSHKSTIRLLICSLMGMDLGRYRDRIEMLTASVSQIIFDVHGPLLKVLGDRNHLPPEIRARAGT